MKNLISVTKNCPCDICQGNHGCAVSLDGRLHSCLRMEGDLPDHKFLYRSGDFSIYVTRYSNNQSSDKKEVRKWIRQNPEHFAKKLPYKEQLSFMTSVFGSRNNPKLILRDHHKDLLLKRGFTEEAIKEQAYFSLWYGLKVDGANEYCPGFDSKGIYRGMQAIALTSLTASGDIKGYHLKPDKVFNDMKYGWAKYTDDKGNIINTSHLRFGDNFELPITFIQGRDPNKTLGMAEGFLKPAKASLTLGFNILGAASYNYKSSFNQLQQELEELKPDNIVFLVDCDSIANEHVYRKIVNQIEHLQGLPARQYYQDRIWIADWGQIDLPKGSTLDCDEISYEYFVANVKYLKLDEFKKRRRDYEKSIETEKDLVDGLTRLNNIVINKISPKKSFNLDTKKVISYIKKTNLTSFKASYLKDQSRWKNKTLTFKAEDREAVYAACVEAGIRIVFDSSEMGSGKSYSTGLFKPEFFKSPDGALVEKLWYLSSQSRKPTTSTIEDNATILPAKHDGLYVDPRSKTPNGKPILVREAGNDSWVKTEGNCGMYARQAHLIKSNIKDSFCDRCHLVSNCSSTAGNYLYDKVEALKSNFISAHFSSVNPKDVGENDVVFLDEAATIPFHTHLRVNYSDIKRLLSLCDQAGVEQAVFVLEQLLHYTASNSSFRSEHKQYGVTRSDYWSYVGGSNESLIHVAARVADLVSEYNKNLIEIGSKDLLLEFAFPLFRALSGVDNDFSFSINNGVISIGCKNHHLIETLKTFKTAFYQDATMTKDQLAAHLGLDSTDILVIAQEQPSDVYSNTIVFQSQLDKFSARQSEVAQEKKRKVKAGLIARYGSKNIGFIDRKAYSEPGDLNKFADGFGSNAFQDKKAICIFGVSKTNLSSAIVEFEILFGKQLSALNKHEFDKFYAQKWQAMTMQEFGRIRSTRRLNDPLDIYIISDEDLGFVEDHEIKLVQFSAKELDASLETTKEKCISALSKEMQNGRDITKLTGKQIEALSGCPSSTMHDLLKELRLGFENELDIKPGDSMGKQFYILLLILLKNPQELLYYNGEILKRIKDVEQRKKLKSSCLKVLAVFKLLVRNEIDAERKRLSILFERDNRFLAQSRLKKDPVLI